MLGKRGRAQGIHSAGADHGRGGMVLELEVCGSILVMVKIAALWQPSSIMWSGRLFLEA